MDLSALQDFEINTGEWIDCHFSHEQYENIPLTFFNRFNKGLIKCCDLSVVPPKKQDAEFTIVEGNTKVINRDHISRTIKMGDRRKNNVASTRTWTKKQKRGMRTWSNQYKTKMKQITVKNDWIIVKSINKRDLSEHIPKVSKVQITELERKGQLHRLNEKVEKISWNPVGFQEKEEYIITPATTLQDTFFRLKAVELMESQGSTRKSLVCSIQFLLALMTVRGGQYPWNILIAKEENVLMFENYKATGDQANQLSYLDLFTTNENTSNNMPADEARIKEQCNIATKYTKIFKDLLAGGEVHKEAEDEDNDEEQEQEVEQNNQQKEGEQEQEQKEAQKLDYIKKYVKIALDDIDIYTNVNVDGIKKKSDGSFEQCLIRAFIETGTDGGWVEDIKKAQGTLVFQEYLANSCSLQKWICEGRIAGVQLIKMGFIGISKQKPLLINVNETTMKSLQNYISFKYSECWPIVKYILDILYNCENGNYVLSRAPYTPLSIKLFKLPIKDEEAQEQS